MRVEGEDLVIGTRCWTVDHIGITCPKCGWDNDRSCHGLTDDNLWYATPFEFVCHACGHEFWVEVDDDDR